MYPRRIWQAPLTRAELIRAAVLCVLYFFLFPLAMAWVQVAAGAELPVAETSVVYYLIAVLLVLLLFWSFLRRDFSTLLDRLPENLAAFASGLVGWVVLDVLIRRIPLPVSDPSELSYRVEYQLSPTATLVIVVVLMPVVEEMLFRGFFYGGLRRSSRVLAWVASVIPFAVYSVWQFTFSYGVVDLRYLLLAVRYLPSGLALTWCYDRGGSVWAAIFLHMAINALTLLRILS
ncbi:MAG TPA: CPBP family intramembrane metalloprotease [Candidatus Flavonifractor merdigallinarum]|uniref:CPBP family intramembrane metalloprotease n=1 Tax=Candidatus Flavonifractor merdigallinarum TaxID=2838589 RepID=A0A9D2BZR7_9FIRM|nr:CPBP family intramembrane metalloprotease [Candidatus Flavonifractor merdigallinarum]